MKNPLLRILGLLSLVPVLCLNAQSSAQPEIKPDRPRFQIVYRTEGENLVYYLIDHAEKRRLPIEGLPEDSGITGLSVDETANTVTFLVDGEEVQIPFLEGPVLEKGPQNREKLEQWLEEQRNPNSELNRGITAEFLSRPGKAVRGEQLPRLPEQAERGRQGAGAPGQ